MDAPRVPIARPSGAPAGNYESTSDLIGQELIDALELQPLDVPRGVWVQADDPGLGACAADAAGRPLKGATVSVNGEVYCLAGLTETPLQEWELAQRIAGHVPCELELEAFRLSERAERLREMGEEEQARSLEIESHELKVEAEDTCT